MKHTCPTDSQLLLVVAAGTADTSVAETGVSQAARVGLALGQAVEDQAVEVHSEEVQSVELHLVEAQAVEAQGAEGQEAMVAATHVPTPGDAGPAMEERSEAASQRALEGGARVFRPSAATATHRLPAEQFSSL